MFFDPYPHLVGGAQKATMLLAEGLAERGWQVTVATPGPGPYVEALAGRRLEHLTLPLPAPLMLYGHQTAGRRAAAAAAALPPAWARLAGALRGRFDVVQTIDHRGQILLGPPSRRAGVPVVWNVHNMEPNRLVNRFAAAFAARVVTPSRSAAGPVGREVIEIPNPLPPAVLGWVGDPPPPIGPALVSVGRLYPQKGYETLIDAVALLRAEGIPVSCRIAGPTPAVQAAYAERLRSRVAGRGLAGAVEFAGQCDDVHSLLAGGGIYVQPARFEAQPLAVLEAMAAGLPVVATRVGGLPTLLGHGQRGLLVAPDDPAALAAGIRAVLDDPASARARVEAARRHLDDRFRPEAVAAAYEAVYRSL